MLVQQILNTRKVARVVTLPADSTLAAAIEILAAVRIGIIVLTDENGGLAGVISERDIIRTLALDGGKALSMGAAEVGSRSVITCTPETTVEDMIGLMSKHTIRHVPVVRGEDVVGMLSARDLLDFQKELLIADI